MSEAEIPLTDEDLYGSESGVAESAEEFAVFRLGREWYGVCLACVRQVVVISKIAFVPGASKWIVGMINVRGDVLSVTDPRRLLGLQAAPAEAGVCLIVEERAVATGLLVEGMPEIAAVERSLLQAPPASAGTVEAAEFLDKSFLWNGHLVGVLRIDRLLRPEEMAS